MSNDNDVQHKLKIASTQFDARQQYKISTYFARFNDFMTDSFNPMQ